jgi:hypothetical protein
MPRTAVGVAYAEGSWPSAYASIPVVIWLHKKDGKTNTFFTLPLLPHLKDSQANPHLFIVLYMHAHHPV